MVIKKIISLWKCEDNKLFLVASYMLVGVLLLIPTIWSQYYTNQGDDCTTILLELSLNRTNAYLEAMKIAFDKVEVSSTWDAYYTTGDQETAASYMEIEKNLSITYKNKVEEINKVYGDAIIIQKQECDNYSEYISWGIYANIGIIIFIFLVTRKYFLKTVNKYTDKKEGGL